VGLALVHSFGTAFATPISLRRWIVPLLLDHTNIGSVLHNKSTPRGHLCNSTAFLLFYVTAAFNFILHVQMA